MIKDKDFKEVIINALEDNNKVAGVIVPNKFPLYKNECNKIISKMGNKTIVITESILQDFTIIGKYVWAALKSNRKLINYGIVSYIAENIKFNSNIIRLNQERIRGYLSTEICNRDYYNAISFLESFSIISKCDISGCYTVNPIAIYKGNIYQFVDISESNEIQAHYSDNNDKLLIDKAVILKDKYATKTEVILNKKYYKDKDEEFNRLSFCFNNK